MKHRRRRMTKWGIPILHEKHKRPMPEGLQIYNLKRLFYKLNPGGNFEDIDLDLIDPTASFPENLEIIKGENWRYRWEIKKRKKKARVKNIIHWKHRCPNGTHYYTSSVPIKQHAMTIKQKNSKGRTKEYKKLYGRIQVIVDKKWIGRDAKIIVRIPDDELYTDAQES
jgi:hypothetical protein